MKLTNSVAITLATAGSLVAAQGHHHQHRHLHKRASETAPSNVVYEFVVANGKDTQPISLEQGCDGLRNNQLKWADAPLWSVCSSSTSTPSPTSTATPTPTPAVLEETSAVLTPSSSSTSTSTPTPTSTAEPTTTSSSSSTTTSVPAPTTPTTPSTGATGLDADFPNGQIDCSAFPTEYGAVPLDYLGLGGWSGIQYVQYSGNSLVGSLINNIVTAVAGDTCREGGMCSYACPPGYQKSQWPDTQGATGQSVGGLECKNGKLFLTNTGLSKKLCVPGVGGVMVKNQLPEDVAVCRTDYPGTESETIPLSALTGTTQPLTCPDSETYFHWQGKPTSAQYYINNKGVSTQVGCQWGDGSAPIGNWAPMNLGVGQSSSGKWLSMFENSPTTNAKLDYNVKLVGDDLSSECKYENGVFYQNGSPIPSGCTAQVMSGNAYFVFY